MSTERWRLEEARERRVPWRKWGPYLSERQWGTVREDYSADGDAWAHFSHEQSHYRTYRWGEDGLAGVSDDKQRLCFALTLWNGADPVLKERLFGLTNSQGNHGEDVKEYYFYLDNTPTHSYMRWLYKYPQAAFPYERLVRANAERNRRELEFELLDTGAFDEDRYFDVLVEYGKESPESLLVRISAVNRGPEPAPLHLLPTLWFRNTWSWSEDEGRPGLGAVEGPPGTRAVAAAHPELGTRYLYCAGAVPLLFTENETNRERLSGVPNERPWVKDGIDAFVVRGRQDAVNPDAAGTKVAAHYVLEIPPGETAVVRLRLTDAAPEALERAYAASGGDPFGPRFDEILAARRTEADAFYDEIAPRAATPEERAVLRQALAGMLWTKQYYFFDVDRWLEEHEAHPLQNPERTQRNRHWFHMLNDDVISMPDKWEYPWYAAWDLAFHCLPLAMVDLDLAKQQLELMLREVYLHPSGQMPAYEWNFGDVNPPVHAWATLFLYSMEKEQRGKGDVEFLKSAFHKLVVNFTWWINRKDPTGRNVFEGGFLGLDNIGVFDRSAPLPTGGHLEQADGTAWMAFFSQNMVEIALEILARDPSYEDMALKYIQHFLWIASAMDRIGDHKDGMWDEEDGFFYDLLRLPDGRASRLKVRSMVGLVPLCATTVLGKSLRDRFPSLALRASSFAARHPEVLRTIAPPYRAGVRERRLLAVLDETKLRRVLARVLDENEFLSDHGIRSLSRYHRDNPFVLQLDGREYRVDYDPAESTSGLFGGNANWRGPVWFPLNALILRALLQFYTYYGDAFTVECPTGSGRQMNLYEISREIARRLVRLFLPDGHGRRPVYGGAEKFQTDPHWRDHLLFYEYFHGDNGAGLGASHQTGWSGLVAKLIQLYGNVNAETLLEGGMTAAVSAARRPRRG
jgi:hypothetical protein